MYANANALLSLVPGILILIRPALLNYIVAIYLIIVGILAWVWSDDFLYVKQVHDILDFHRILPMRQSLTWVLVNP